MEGFLFAIVTIVAFLVGKHWNDVINFFEDFE